MSKQASIKGSIVASHAEVLRKHIEQQQPEERLLNSRFEPGELDVLLGEIRPTDWYDIEMYRRMMEFLRDHDGNGSNQYLIDAGRRSGDNLIRAGIHAQFEYLQRTQHAEETSAEDRSQAFGRDLRLLATISASIINFSTPNVVSDETHPLRWAIHHEPTYPYPEILCWTSQGFMNRMAEEHGAGPDLWSWDHPSPDLVRFRMCRDI